LCKPIGPRIDETKLLVSALTRGNLDDSHIVIAALTLSADPAQVAKLEPLN
jgi:hypothetical protein